MELDRAEGERLCREAQAGDAGAMERLIERLRPKIRQIVRRYATRSTFDDLVQEGILGLYRAVERFDPGVPGAGFPAYAYQWIRKLVREACLDGALVRVPPTYCRRLKPGERSRPAQTAADKVRAAHVFPVRAWDRVGGPPGEEPAESSAALGAAAEMAKLPMIQRFVLGRRFGFDGAAERSTYEAIADEVGCRPGAIRDIERTAVARLRSLLAGDVAGGFPKSLPANG